MTPSGSPERIRDGARPTAILGGVSDVDVDVLVIGGGLAGVAAACQAGRLGSRVVLATRGRHLALDATTLGVLPGTRLASALFLELLGGPSTAGGRRAWAARAPHELEAEPCATTQRAGETLRAAGVEVWFETRVVAVQREGSRVVGATLERGPAGSPDLGAGERRELRARVTIDASPWGDVLSAAGAATTSELDERLGAAAAHAVAAHAVEWDAALRLTSDAVVEEPDPAWRAWIAQARRADGRLAVARPLPGEPPPPDEPAATDGAEPAEAAARERALRRIARLRERPSLRAAIVDTTTLGDPDGLAPAARVLRPARLWLWLDKFRLNPSIPLKFVFGFLLIGSSYFVLVWGIATSTDRVAWEWLVLFFFLYTAAEMVLSPVGLAMTTDLAPKNLTGLAMGIWLLATSGGLYVGGVLASVAAVPKGTSAAATKQIYQSGFGEFGWIALATGLLLCAPGPLAQTHDAPAHGCPLKGRGKSGPSLEPLARLREREGPVASAMGG